MLLHDVLTQSLNVMRTETFMSNDRDSNSRDPNVKQPGEKEEGKFHYNPGNMSGKTPEKPADQEQKKDADDTHAHKQDPKP